MKEIFKKLKIILIGFIVIFCYCYAINPILSYFYEEPIFVRSIAKIQMRYYLSFICFLGPIIEEITYRIIPVTITNILNEKLYWPIVYLSSIIFGLQHGRGTLSVLVQGVVGLVFAVVYKKTDHTAWCPILLHSMYNISCLYCYY